MRPRASLTGPLVLIVVGAIFLIHAISPEFAVGDLFLRYWPYLLILWGVIAFIEVSIRFARSGQIPANGISGGGWVVVVFICLAGMAAYEMHRVNPWWRQMGWERGVEAFGAEHEYSIDPQRKGVGAAPRIVLESLRGDVKITGAEGTEVSLGGHKLVRAFEERLADVANRDTPIDIVVEGSTVIVRSHQDRADSRSRVTANLELSVPKGASVEATGTGGDFDVSGLMGDVDFSSSNAGVRLQDIGGNVKIDTRRSDLIRCINVKGTVDLRGHGSDVELQKIAGQVNVNGDYTGSVSLREMAKPVRLASMRTQLDVQQVPGEIHLERGSLNARNVIGPVKVTAHSTDITLSGFTEGLDLTVDRGDIELRPQNVPIGHIAVHARSGNIEMALPVAAKFALNAATGNGEVDNQFGDGLRARSEGRGAKLDGSVGDGPDVSLITQHGNITVRKSSGDSNPPKGSGGEPATLKRQGNVAGLVVAAER
jgi:DUF4097 and DUF4098 domain-containing protein YvlB